MSQSITLNDNVEVKLNSLGRAILRTRWEFLKSKSPDVFLKYVPVAESDDGWSRWLLWELFDAFGDHIRMGKNQPFGDFRIAAPETILKP